MTQNMKCITNAQTYIIREFTSARKFYERNRFPDNQ